jgi:hypothetical protein
MKTTYKKYGHRPTSTHCLVLDMDDTLCIYDEDLRLRRCEEFAPRERELTIALAGQAHGYDIVICTARPHFTWPSTVEWLRRHNLRPAAIYMRDGYQPREVATSQVKAAMLTSVLRTWEVEAFYDDSPWTIQAATDMGLNAVLVPGKEAWWAERGDG